MRCCRLLKTQTPLPTILLLAALCGCDSTQYRNANHPNFGDAEYKSDLAQCRKENSKIVMVTGYDDKSEVHTDEDKARACMTQRGWQAVSK
jgi:hypothetical protein